MEVLELSLFIRNRINCMFAVKSLFCSTQMIQILEVWSIMMFLVHI